jgi:imidazolonepropionase-like amidohydrolase
VDVTDVSGQWITPGLIDAHVHFSQTGWVDGRPDAFDVRDRHPYETAMAENKAHPERFLQSHLCAGVTSVFDVGGYPWTLGLPQRAHRAGRAPRVVAAGPLLSTMDFWLNLPGERQFIHLKDAEAARRGVRYLAAQGAAAVKVWYIVRPDLPVEASAAAVRAAGEEARARHLPLIVHATGLAEAKVAVEAGARLLVHGVYDQPVDDEFLDKARRNGTLYCPTLTVLGGYAALGDGIADQRTPALDDPNACVDAATRAKVAETATLSAPERTPERRAAAARRTAERAALSAANLKRARDAGLTIVMGTDAGNPLTLHGPSVYAEMEAMQAAGLPAAEVLVMSTRNGALAMGRLKDFGTLEAGKLADLLILTEDPRENVRAFRSRTQVMRGGRLYQQTALAQR